jgi:hypothetical protein
MPPVECKSMGVFNAQQHLERKVGDDPVSVPNLLLQKWDTYGAFSWSRGNYLEVVAGPSV